MSPFRPPPRTKENGFERDGALHPDVHPSKRPCTISPAQRFSPSNGLSYQPNGLPHPGPLPPQHYRLDDMAIAHHYRDTYRHPASNHREIRERARPIGEDMEEGGGCICVCKGLSIHFNFKKQNHQQFHFMEYWYLLVDNCLSDVEVMLLPQTAQTKLRPQQTNGCLK